MNSYFIGAIAAFCYLTTERLLPKKIKGILRVALAIIIAAILSCLIQYIIDLIVE